jgi:hypothetical protein
MKEGRSETNLKFIQNLKRNSLTETNLQNANLDDKNEMLGNH